jgi:hypothetical protein
VSISVRDVDLDSGVDLQEVEIAAAVTMNSTCRR